MLILGRYFWDIMYGTRIDDNQLERIYDDFSREQGMLMADLKTKQEEDKEKDIMKELTLINSLMMNTLRLINLRKKIRMKVNL